MPLPKNTQNLLNASRIHFIYKCKQIQVLITIRLFFICLVFCLLNSQVLSLPLTILVRERQVHLFFYEEERHSRGFHGSKIVFVRKEIIYFNSVTIFVSLFPVNLLVRFCHSHSFAKQFSAIP